MLPYDLLLCGVFIYMFRSVEASHVRSNLNDFCDKSQFL